MEQTDAFAKLNLSLAVTGRGDGFHSLDTVNVTIDLKDTIQLERDECDAKVDWVACNAPVGDMPRESNALRAVRGMAAIAGRKGAHVTVRRNIPDKAGLGGSSAQAAGIIRLLGTHWNLDLGDDRVRVLAASLGSDVPMLLASGYTRVQGRGERVERLSFDTKLYFVLACDGVCSTKEVFEAYDVRPTAARANAELLMRDLSRGTAKHCDNDLTDAAIGVCPAIRDTLAELERYDPLAVSLTGSGAACFAVYASRLEAEIAARNVRAEWVAVAETVI